MNNFYDKYVGILQNYRKTSVKPLSFSEKIFLAHQFRCTDNFFDSDILTLRPDRVAMQDATAQMAMLQFIQTNINQTNVPASVHCDHLIQSKSGATEDLKRAIQYNKEVYDFLSSSSKRYGIDFWEPNSGIIHQVILENYAFPGGLLIGTDSHSPNAGGMGMMAIGVGGSDASEVMAGYHWEIKRPKIVGIHVYGDLHRWVSAKDVILYLCTLLSTKGGTGKILEYFGTGLEKISITERATIANMGAELGATTSIFPCDESIVQYLSMTSREDLGMCIKKYIPHLSADSAVYANPEMYYDEVIQMDLSSLEPYIVGPHSPDVGRKLSDMKVDVKEKCYVDRISYGLIGSCTNSSYEDISKVTFLARWAIENKLQLKSPVYLSPGSQRILDTIQLNGQIDILKKIGVILLSNACGPCIGQWQRDELETNKPNSIITSFNRNFQGRNDGSTNTQSFIASPEIVFAIALSGNLSFNPCVDPIINDEGKSLFMPFPDIIDWQKNSKFIRTERVKSNPADHSVKISISPTSSRLKLLTPFEKNVSADFANLLLLAKINGKCTTDHISPAGKWLKFRGHLEKISKNFLLGANNSFSVVTGCGKNLIDKKEDIPLHVIANHYKSKKLRWIIVADENYGEGSSREHAAMSLRFLGGVAVITKSFARIHETNLKKSGVLPLTFRNTADYGCIEQTDALSILNVDSIRVGVPLDVIVKKKDGNLIYISCLHSLTEEQLNWFYDGSALNTITK